MADVKFQVNQMGSWRNVLTICETAEAEEAAVQAAQLLATAAPGSRFALLFQDGHREHLSLPAAPAADASAPAGADAGAVQAALAAIQAVRRIAGEVRLTAEVRLHYLRCVRMNLASAEDRLAELDDLPPRVAGAFGDIARDIHHVAANPED